MHTGGGGGGCCILEKQHVIYPTSKFSHYFYPSSQHSIPSPCPCWGWAAGAPCLAELHMAAIAQRPAWLGRGRAGDRTREAFGAAAPSGVNQEGFEVPFQRGGVLTRQSPAGLSSASCAGRTPSSSAPAPAASSAAAPPPPAPAPCWPWRQRGLRPGSECPARKGVGLRPGNASSSTEGGS